MYPPERSEIADGGVPPERRTVPMTAATDPEVEAFSGSNRRLEFLRNSELVRRRGDLAGLVVVPSVIPAFAVVTEMHGRSRAAENM